MRTLFSTLAGLFLALSAYPQDQPSFEKRPFKDPDGNLYWPLSMPVYFQLTTSPNAVEGMVLTQASETAVAMKWDGHGKHYIKHDDSMHSKESTVSFPVNVDGIAPVSAVELTGAIRYATATRVYFGKGLSVFAKAKDEMSGLEGVYMSVNQAAFMKLTSPVALTEEKEYQVQYFAVDKVGNTEQPRPANFAVDLTPPVSSHVVNGANLDGQILAPGAIITIAGRDEGSGIKKTEYAFDNGKFVPYAGKISMAGLADGEHTLSYFSHDQVGNTELTKAFTFYLDSKGPDVKSSFDANFAVSEGRSYATSGTSVALEATAFGS